MMETHSCIYEGSVRHRRFSPKPHDFSYRLFMMYLDLQELDYLFARRWLWSSKRFNLAQFRRTDHWGDPTVPLPQAISRLIEAHTGKAHTGPIRLLTHLRYFGYCFNPVSFYFCYDEREVLQTIVAEINNTPWGETHCYVLNESLNEGDRKKKRYRFGKDFHVSPFMSMDIDYDWYFTIPQGTLNVHMENRETNEKFFDATMTLRRQEIDAFSLNLVLFRYPFMTGKVMAAIHWNALRLWMKGSPFYTHPHKRMNHLETQRQ